MSRLKFQLERTASLSQARAARFKTLHNEVLTPTFMPVGTHAAVRSQRREDLLDAGAQVLLANTYHLLLRPGVDIFKQFGGIHNFMKWPRSVLTDSGGFQIFCMATSRTMAEDGAYFKSYVDNQIICLSPEKSIETQMAIGSDIMMVLDQCVPSTVDHDTAKAAMHLTHRWARRSLKARSDSPQSLFGIVQGACYDDLRIESAKTITDMPFDGYAIGGLAVGETREERERCTALVTDHLPPDRPRYLMGVGTTLDLLEAVHRGVDMFDCILPTSMAQQGKAFTSLGRRDLRRGVYRTLDEPLDPQCDCYTCKTYSLAYLFHCLRVHESQAWQWIGIHNIHFYMNLMKTMRAHILADTWLPFYNEAKERLDARDSYGPKSVRYAKTQHEEKELSLGRFRIVSPKENPRIQDKSNLEIMHSVNDPATEARVLYVEQSRLAEKCREITDDPLVIWDVGLGAATNVMTAIFTLEQSMEPLRHQRPIHIISFENDLDALRLAAKFPSMFATLKHEAPHKLLKIGSWAHKSLPITWDLKVGDFKDLYKSATKPNIIFYDPFSHKADASLWTYNLFAELFCYCENQSVELMTYTASTAVRAGLLAAGFYVCYGAATGPKSDTTFAATPKAQSARNDLKLLDQTWLERWQRSDAKRPFGEGFEQAVIESKILNHPQFY
jgi:queuine tRNA-ribosyltransferase